MDENNKPSDAYSEGVHDAGMILQIGFEEKIAQLKREKMEAYDEGYADGKASYSADIDIIQIRLKGLEQAVEELIRKLEHKKEER